MKGPKTLYVSDLDGTLLRRDQTVSPFTAETINTLTARGMPVPMGSPDNPVCRGHCTPLPSMPFLQESYFTTGELYRKSSLAGFIPQAVNTTSVSKR